MTEPSASSESFQVGRAGVALIGERWPGGPPTAVLIHSGVSDRRSWREVAQRLASVATVVTYDCRGYGESALTPGSFSHLDDLLAVLDAVTDGTVWLVGNSMGGRIALDAAVTVPDRVAGLVLIAPGVSGAPAATFDPDTRRLDALLEEADAAGDKEEVARLLIHVWLDGSAQPFGRVTGAARDLALDMLRIILRNDAPEEAEDVGVDAWSRLGEVGVPVVVACGDLDLPHLLERSRALAGRLPHGRLQVLPGMAHLPSLEDPAAVADLIATAVRGR